MDTQTLERSRTRNAVWLLLALAGCASETPADSDLPMGMQPTQSMQPTSMQPAAGNKASGMTMSGAAGKAATPTSSGTAGAKAAAAGAGGGSAGTTATAGSGGPKAAAAGAGGGGAGSGGSMAAAAGSAAGAGAAGSAGMSGSSAAGSGGAKVAGAGGAGGSGGASGAGGAAGMMAAAEHEDLGEGDGTDVVLIGDSWMSNTLQIEGTGGGVAPSLQRVSGQRYPNYGVQGTELLMANTFGPAIPTQWDDAKRRNPMIKTVVMTAGGNDVIQGSPTLQASCQMGTDECKKKLVVISEALDKLWTQMAADGVQDIVHIRYTDNTGTLHPDLQGGKGLPTPTICLSGKVRCHGVTTTDIVAKSDLAADGIHPLASANNRIAMRTYDLMKSEGMRR